MVEEAILDYIKVNLDKNDIDEIVSQIEKDKEKERLVNQVEQLKKDLEKIQTRKRKFQMMYVDDLISKEDYIERTQEMTTEEKRIKATLNEMVIPSDEDIHYQEELHNMLSEFQSIYGSLSVEEWKTMVNEIIKNITLNAFKESPRQRPDIKVNIEYK
ncbi:hypothetical protein [Melghirimyces algeriensis]|uniref:Uncharacterized protein n=1 Tax=Melghirimyces algeriensis TaxID=910412 RepID=A0A521D051_9BACL|nr:hypothetical protein [Melghirimyces algeriensis]SMO65038.1 hypothetical protein SAMN06264849_1053 [Melghirimyces algeriensis]